MKWTRGLVFVLVLVTALVVVGCAPAEETTEQAVTEPVTTETQVEEMDQVETTESESLVTTSADMTEETVDLAVEETSEMVETPETPETTESENVTIGILTPDQKLERDQLVIDFALEDLNGNVVQLSEYKGNLVLLNFWTTW